MAHPSGRWKFALAAGSLGLLSQPSLALAHGTSPTAKALFERLSSVKTWTFISRKIGTDGAPECTEIWEFDGSGVGRIQSGQQRIVNQWRVEKRDDGYHWLITTAQTGNGLPDCMGSTTDPASYPKDEFGFAVLTDADTKALHMCMWPSMIARSNPASIKLSEEAACFGHLEARKRN
ncbi:hypothetical protein [Erythrobacter sp. F6033]|uniref:hypothetical protein n=1 Tax=Erythrobacter sp. F6033 TaxID=2926401 RepID=UPI001FF20C60|nr:hypothetical protein [Erythrobacter sp. F6033]MCK0129776.1 hypothetical protein [Erythrobacter sp. F6033]